MEFNKILLINQITITCHNENRHVENGHFQVGYTNITKLLLINGSKLNFINPFVNRKSNCTSLEMMDN